MINVGLVGAVGKISAFQPQGLLLIPSFAAINTFVLYWSILYHVSTLHQVIMNYYWFGDNLKDAVSRPRLHAQLFPDIVLVEENFSPKIAADLRKNYKHRYISNDTALFTGNYCESYIFHSLIISYLFNHDKLILFN